MNTAMQVETFNLGSWMTNCYLVGDEALNTRCVIDAGFEPEEMIDYIKGRGLECETLIFTHSHLDHIAGAVEFLAEWPDMEILIHEAEEKYLTDPRLNLSAMAGTSVTAPPATGTLKHGQVLETAGVTFTVLHTPGHSPGGICLYCAKGGTAFVGDTLFHGSVGRYDLPDSDGEALFDAIRKRLLALPDETRFFPGHGPSGTIGEERRTNPFLAGMNT